MPKDKTETHERVLLSAKQEFLEQGYEKASMRKIASKAGITAGGLYRHFKTKEAMFETLVEPTLRQYCKRNEELTNASIQRFIESDIDAFRAASEDGNKEVLDFIYGHFDEFHLMFNSSVGTKYENIRHELVTLEVRGAKRLIQVIKSRNVPIRDFNDEQLHILYSTALTPLFEIITHGYSYNKAYDFFELMEKAMNFGWEMIFDI